jgi:hypothetical protein
VGSEMCIRDRPGRDDPSDSDSSPTRAKSSKSPGKVRDCGGVSDYSESKNAAAQRARYERKRDEIKSKNLERYHDNKDRVKALQYINLYNKGCVKPRQSTMDKYGIKCIEGVYVLT